MKLKTTSSIQKFSNIIFCVQTEQSELTWEVRTLYGSRILPETIEGSKTSTSILRKDSLSKNLHSIQLMSVYISKKHCKCDCNMKATTTTDEINFVKEYPYNTTACKSRRCKVWNQISPRKPLCKHLKLYPLLATILQRCWEAAKLALFDKLGYFFVSCTQL